MYVIIGATGNTGKVIAERLLTGGQKVRVIGRDAKRLQGFVQKGAEAAVADATDREALAKAFSGARAVYVLVPPNNAAPDVGAYQEQVSGAAAAAIERAEVEYAVLLSSIGADKPSGTGPVAGLHRFEQKLGGVSKLNALYVRAGYFMSNMLPQVGVIKAMGAMAGPLRGGLAVPMIAPRDIGAYAAEALLQLNFTGQQAIELHGQRDLTYDEAAKVIGGAIGKPDLGYSQLPPSQLKPALVQMGLSPNMADLLLEMSDALNSGYMAALEPRSSRNTTPTSIEQWVSEEFAPAFTGKAAGA